MFQKILVNKKGKSEWKNSLKLLKNYIKTVSCFHSCSKEFHEYIIQYFSFINFSKIYHEFVRRENLSKKITWNTQKLLKYNIMFS